MKRILRVALMVLLTAVLGVGNAWGKGKVWTDGNGVQWEYEEIEAGKTCRIWPKDGYRISGSVDIPGAVKEGGVSIKVVSIGGSAFWGCSGLTAVTIPGSVTKIGERAFSGCSGLTAVTIPGSVTEVGKWAFSGCSGLKSIGVESGNKNYCAESGVLFTKDKATLICYPEGKPEESYTIPSSVKAIGEYAFSGCSGLTAVTIPGSVTEIGEAAFAWCSGLTAMTIPGSVTEIGTGAFSICSGLKALEVESGNKNYCAESGVLFTKGRDTLICYPGGKPEESYTIPGSVTEIGAWAFENCSGLKAVTIPSSVTEIGESAFSGCSGLKSIAVESGNKNYCAAGGVLFTKDKATLICYPGRKPEESYVISSSVTKLAECAFSDCRGLTAVTIPGSVTEIGKWAFSGCSGLTSVTISEGVKTIGDGAFEYCIGLTAVTIPGSVTEIGWRAFSGCRGLTAATIPGSVTKIGNEAFFCCKGLTVVTIPGSVTEIGERAFAWCSGLTEVTIPGSVTEIGKWAFEDCIGLTEVTIPGSVTEIGSEAFSGCWRLNAVYWLADANCSVEDDAFKEIAFRSTLYVRHGEKAAIEGNGQTWWKKFDEIVEGYVVTFQDWEGNKLGEQLVKPDGTATAPTAPTKEGYIVEWQLDGNKYDFSKKVEKDITLVAVWKQSYTVTFDAKGGKPTPDAQKVVKDGTATAPTDPTKKGYTFVEWQLDGAKYDFGTPVTKDITLVAVWKQNYTVTFDAKGGTPTPDAQKVVKDGTATAPTAPAKKGYTFVEWQLDGAKYDFSKPVTKDITLVAVWKQKDDPKTAVESVQLAAVRAVRNPVGEALELEGMERAARVEVYSVAGARVHAEALRGTPRVVIDAQGWASGVYVVRVVASDGERTLRVVK